MRACCQRSQKRTTVNRSFYGCADVTSLDACFDDAAESAANPRYLIGRRVGMGGASQVFEAFDSVLNRTVALKFLDAEDPAWTERFLRGARAQSRVNHERVCRVYHVGLLEGRPFVAMQFVDGLTLASVSCQLTLEQKVRLLAQVAEALHAAHLCGVVHRDIKPDNILVQRTDGGNWKPYLTDFGLARESGVPGPTLAGTIAGTPAYMSPEQARGDVHRLDCRADIYGLGATLYELLAGRPPFDGDSIGDVIRKVIDQEPVPLRKLDRSIPAELEAIASRCLEKEPELRYASADILAQDLFHYLDGGPIEAKPPGKLLRLAGVVKANSSIVAVAIAGIVAFSSACWIVSRRHQP